MQTSWTPPSLVSVPESSVSLPPPPPPIDLSPLSSAQIHEQNRLNHDQRQISMKLSKQSHRHYHGRHHHHHHPNISSHNKRKRTSTVESTIVVKEEINQESKEEISTIVSNEQFKQEDNNDTDLIEPIKETPVDISKVPIDENNHINVLTTVKESTEINNNLDEQVSAMSDTLLLTSKNNRDLLRKNISQHVHVTLKPFTKRICKQGRITSTDDMKYLVKKFTLAVLDKEIEKAKNDGVPLSPILTERVRLKTEVYVKKYMNKAGPVFQRHDTTAHPSFQTPQQTTTTNLE